MRKVGDDEYGVVDVARSLPLPWELATAEFAFDQLTERADEDVAPAYVVLIEVFRDDGSRSLADRAGGCCELQSPIVWQSVA